MPNVPFVVDVLADTRPIPLPPQPESKPAQPSAPTWPAELLAAMTGCRRASDAAQLTADVLCQRLGLAQAAVGLCGVRGKRCRLTAISGCRGFDRRSELAEAMQAVLDETALRARSGGPADSSPANPTADEQRVLSLRGATHLHTAALKGPQGNLRGAWVLVAKQPFTDGPAWRELAGAVPQLAGCLGLLVRADPGPAARFVQRLANRWRGGRAAVAALVLVLAAAVLAVPWPYRVRGECRIQPTVRRFVAAPFEAKLDEAFVELGDMVRKGQPLARLNDREIRWELAGLEADYNRAQKMRDGSLAGQEVASAQIAGLEMERLALRIRLLKDRIEKLEIRAPIDGLVIAGDLKKTVGAPLTRGQSMFEIAPMGHMLVEVAIPDHEVGLVSPGRPVDIRLDAIPRLAFAGDLGKIHPRAEQLDGHNVFIGEVLLPNPDQVLRPGMFGRATVEGPRRPLGWNLFHRAYESVCAFGGW